MVPPIKGSFEVEIKTDKQADGIVEDLNEQERKRLLDALNKKMGVKEEKKENKETVENLPKLEEKNLRIDSTNWKEVTDSNGVKVKENPEGDVREYLEGKYVGEQLFTGDEFDNNGNIIKEGSATREAKKAGKTLPASCTTYIDIINKKYEGNYQSFLTGEKIIFAGWRHPDIQTFNYLYKHFDLRCADGTTFHGNRYEWHIYEGFEDFGFSVRCLKD